MKKYFCFLFATMLCIGFVGCSKDDDGKKNEESYEKLIVGTWECNKSWDVDYGYSHYRDGEYGILFKANGTGFFLEEDERYEFEWDIDGSTLYINFEDEGEEGVEVEDRYKIETLNKDELVLSYAGGDYIEYFERIK